MAMCGTCSRYKTCYIGEELANNYDHEVCSLYDLHIPESFKKHVKELKEMSESNANHPAYYIHGDVECYDAMEAAMPVEQVKGFYKGCIFKYLWREEDKDGLKDLEKLKNYAIRLYDFCARMEKPGDVPHDASTGSAVDTD